MTTIGGVFYFAARRGFDDRVRAANAAATEEAVDRLRQTNRIQLSDLFVLNRRQLDEYHVNSLTEQRTAFQRAQITSLVGFVFLLLGVTLSFRAGADSERYTSAGLTALGALLSGYVSRVFFKSYSETSKALRHYYSEPLRTGQVLTAERLACLDGHVDLEQNVVMELRKQLVGRLIDQLPVSPLTPVDGAKPGEGKAGEQERP
ncbi:hypothetical protein GKQ77_13895 [Streptomyces sp. BG9H]|uniref:Cyanobacterial TRADD-N associated 2 transmembrane domain-containing protein n=1 Tax=Streptomyces anatolicus TaxID=2675858 RepID=A0ABS6YMK3_9ACTN|nr:hypothetical protein [Streptomyces anatolicus]MBW5422642.1 hypothetical protein [Streptomyces anatolicus]